MSQRIIGVNDLADFLGVETVASDSRAAYIVGLTNGLLAEVWAAPVDPVPTSVQVLALEVAARGFQARPGAGRMESVTRSIDDGSRTERYAASVADQTGRSVFLTDDEEARLNGSSPVVTEDSFVGSVKYR